MDAKNQPQNLREAMRYFADPDVCLDYIAKLRWPNGVCCPTCGSVDVRFLATRRVWECKSKHPKKQFSVKVGTIFEDSPITLGKWLAAIWMIANDKNGISSYELSRAIGVTQKSAWFMLHRIRLAMQSGSFERMTGEVKIDETLVGGNIANMHRHVRERKITGGGPSGKTVVMGLPERGGYVRSAVIPNRESETLKPIIEQNVDNKAELFTDAHADYNALGADYLHSVIDHAVAYVGGNVHTNKMEYFWTLLKRTTNGTCVSIEPVHPEPYLDEQTFRFNSRKVNDGERFEEAAIGIVGRRLTYAGLIGKVNWSGVLVAERQWTGPARAKGAP
jgi:hypothetical protein